ncbi:MAG: hypothetical protein QXN16_04330 [Candidatus Micrarchaeaceae archaeon]
MTNKSSIVGGDVKKTDSVTIGQTPNEVTKVQLTLNELTKLEKDAEETKKKKLLEKGYHMIMMLNIGENKFQIQQDEGMRYVDTKYGRKAVFVVKRGEEILDFFVTVDSKLYRDIIHALIDGHSNFNLIKIGSGVDTRYQLITL